VTQRLLNDEHGRPALLSLVPTSPARSVSDRRRRRLSLLARIRRCNYHMQQWHNRSSLWILVADGWFMEHRRGSSVPGPGHQICSGWRCRGTPLGRPPLEPRRKNRRHAHITFRPSTGKARMIASRHGETLTRNVGREIGPYHAHIEHAIRVHSLYTCRRDSPARAKTCRIPITCAGRDTTPDTSAIAKLLRDTMLHTRVGHTVVL